MKVIAFCLSILLTQAKQNISEITILYRTTNTYVLYNHKNRRIDELTDEEAHTWTRFTKAQLHKLFDLFYLPFCLTVHKTHHYNAEFVFLLPLSYITSCEKNSTLKKFGCYPVYFGSIVKEFVQHLP